MTENLKRAAVPDTHDLSRKTKVILRGFQVDSVPASAQ
jgi:hypothetical protein